MINNNTYVHSFAILGAVAAIGQNNIKRFSPIVQLAIGYMLGMVQVRPQVTQVQYLKVNLCSHEYWSFLRIYLMKRKGNYTEEIKDLLEFPKNSLIAIAFLVVFFISGNTSGGFFKILRFTAVIENEMFILATIGLLTTVISAFII